MSGRKMIAIKNSSIGLIGQVISLCLQIVSRKMFIEFIGTELLGVNTTFTSILQTLSLTELGFQRAISYNLYRPLAEKDEERINEIVNVYKLVYRGIGIIFTICSFVVLPVLPWQLSNVEVTRDIYIFFLLQAAASTCTYFLAYKRTILYADQKEYVYKTVDTVMNTIFKLAQIFVIVRFQSYYAYIILTIIQAYLGNLIVHRMSRKYYPYLKKSKFSKKCAKEVFADAKHIFASRFAGYAYAQADNLIVSKMMGVVQVAYLGNYTTITTNLRLLINSVMEPLTPIVGNYLTETKDAQAQEKKLQISAHIRFIFALVMVVPALILVDDFIRMWIGDDFVMQASTKILLMADMYLYLIQGACNDYVVGKGLFKPDKYITIIGVVMNLVLSIALVWEWGVTGVLLGTVISQTFNWLGHAWVVYKYSFEANIAQYVKYIVKNIYYVGCTIAIAWACNILYGMVDIDVFILKFVCGGILCEIVGAIGYLVLCFKCREFRELLNMILSLIHKKRNMGGNID